MRIFAPLTYALVLLPSMATVGGEVWEAILIRPTGYANEVMRIERAELVTSLYELVSGVVNSTPKPKGPFPGVAPLYRFEFVNSQGQRGIYDFVARSKEPKLRSSIFFWHEEAFYGVSAAKIEEWCRNANVPFEKYFEPYDYSPYE